ncbi:YfjI family protein [Actinopolymorpha sp. B9G3]|uniref:YfjI family protein n=1 Tax=Actinopolymorpha sp. B9G3 TaxID=3158970 RepID=UPI0032D8F551
MTSSAAGVPLSADRILDRLDARRSVEQHHTGREPIQEPWEPPIPLTGRRQLPPFPVEVLPGWVADQVAAVAEFTQTPPDLAGCVALATLSTAAGGKAEVVVRGFWREPVNIFTVVALPPGARKSPVFTAMTEPLLLAERALAEKTRPQIIEAELAASTARALADRAAAAAAKADAANRAQAMAEASDAAMTARTIEVPVMPTLVADDITPEAAAGLLAEQGGRLAVLSDEGGIFATLAGRYSGIPNLEVFLKGHAGTMLRVHRRGRDPELVDNPALTLGLAVQPDVLHDIAQMPGFRGRGLLARILFSVPENTVGRRRIGTAPVPEQVAHAYTHNLQSLVLTLADLRERALLPLTDTASEAVLALEADVEPKLAPTAAWAHVVDWGSKYVGAIIRLAGLLHLADHLRDGYQQPITAAIIHRAATLGRYYADHALAAFDAMGADPLIEDARVILDWLQRHKPDRLTKRELFTALPRPRFKRVTELDPVLDLLDQHGYLRRLPDPPRTGPGRPGSPEYLVNQLVR